MFLSSHSSKSVRLFRTNPGVDGGDVELRVGVVSVEDLGGTENGWTKCLGSGASAGRDWIDSKRHWT